MAAARVVEETQLTTEALTTLRKQWEDSSTIAIKAIAFSIALQDAARALKKDSQQATQSTQVEDKEGLDRLSSDDKVLDEDKDDTKIDDVMGSIKEQLAPEIP